MSSPPAPNTKFKAPSGRDIVTGLITGFVFGFLLEKTKVYQPHVIFSQMIFTNFIMLKVFLSATAVGMGVYLFLEMSGIRARPPPLNSSLSVTNYTPYDGNIAGGFVLGCGMSISGACPGQALAQFGAGVPSGKYVLAGGLTAVVVFAYASHALTKWRGGKPVHAVTPGRKLDGDIIARPFWQLFIGLAGMMAAIVAVCAVAFPWKNEVANYVGSLSNPGSTPLTEPAWNPIQAAVLIGLLQLFAIVAGGSPLGQSSCYVTVTGSCLSFVDNNLYDHAPYFFRHFESWHWWQVGVATANVFGAYVSFTISQSTLTAFALANTPGPAQAFFGGFLMLFGARLGDGCPSGHGLSGMARLNSAAFVTVIAMFAGGISTAVLMGSLV